MKKRMLMTFLMLAFAGLTACRNLYEKETYAATDSYDSVFRGKYVPQDAR